MDWKIPLFKIYSDAQDIQEVATVISSGKAWAIGPHIEKFEQLIAKYVGMNYALVFNSGTSALHAVLLAYNIQEGDEIIVPSFTFIATANSPLFVKAKPVFAEIEERTLGLDPEDVERKITPQTKAIMPIHYAGCPCSIADLQKIARKHNLLLIEDAAEAFGGKVNEHMAGSYGDASALSFCQNKIISTGEGGAVLTNSPDIYSKLKLIRSHGRQELSDYFSSIEDAEYVDIGYNFRMSDITAALGLTQLAKVDKIIDMRRSNANYLNRRLSGIHQITVPTAPEGYLHVYQAYTIRLKEHGHLRDKLRHFLAQRGIMSKVYFHPVHLTQFYRRNFGFKDGDLPVTEKIASEVLTLPMFPTLTESEMDYMVEQIEVFFAV
jgi:perosamine synthetase